MVKKLRDALKRFIKLHNERNDYFGDEGWASITEELEGVSDEIEQLLRNMIKA